MITLILPGLSKHNKEWVDEVAKRLKVPGEVRPIYWDHWDDPNAPFDPIEKARSLEGVLVDKEINIIAKSIGTLVACQLIPNISDKLRKVIFCGIPMGNVQGRHDVYQKALATIPADKIIVMQNENDPLGNFVQVKEFIAKLNSQITVSSTPRSDHNYPYFEEFQKFIGI